MVGETESQRAPYRIRVLDLDAVSAVKRSPVLQPSAASGVLVECKGSGPSKDDVMNCGRVL